MLYAVGDIHGELGKLRSLVAALPLAEGDRFVFVGDYVDRGPEPFGVVDFLVEFSHRHPCVFLMGNHESMFLDFLGWRGPAYFGGDAFLVNGGDRTLASYGYFDLPDPHPSRFNLPPSHEKFMRELKLYHQDGDYLFVHAGLGREQLEGTDVDYALRRAREEDAG